MDYLKAYNGLIATRKLLNRGASDNVFYEKHHIVPKSFGGDNSNKNLVFLTAKEHFLAHLLLFEIFSGEKKMKMSFALWCMCCIKGEHRGNLKISSRQYSRIKEEFIKNKKGVSHRIGMKHSEKTKRIIRYKRQFQKIDGIKIANSRIKNGTNKRSALCKQRMSLSSPCKKSVSQFTDDGIWVKDFSSMQNAAKSIGVTVCCISDCINGRQKTSKGFIFKLKAA